MFGSTYNGQYEDVKAFNDKVGEPLHLHARPPVTALHAAQHLCFMTGSPCTFACSACDAELCSFFDQPTVFEISCVPHVAKHERA